MQCIVHMVKRTIPIPNRATRMQLASFNMVSLISLDIWNCIRWNISNDRHHSSWYHILGATIPIIRIKTSRLSQSQLQYHWNSNHQYHRKTRTYFSQYCPISSRHLHRIFSYTHQDVSRLTWTRITTQWFTCSQTEYIRRRTGHASLFTRMAKFPSSDILLLSRTSSSLSFIFRNMLV